MFWQGLYVRCHQDTCPVSQLVGALPSPRRLRARAAGRHTVGGRLLTWGVAGQGPLREGAGAEGPASSGGASTHLVQPLEECVLVLCTPRLPLSPDLPALFLLTSR